MALYNPVAQGGTVAPDAGARLQAVLRHREALAVGPGDSVKCLTQRTGRLVGYNVGPQKQKPSWVVTPKTRVYGKYVELAMVYKTNV